ncbi:unnamed protein product [Caenorhabditis nigoni]
MILGHSNQDHICSGTKGKGMLRLWDQHRGLRGRLPRQTPGLAWIESRWQKRQSKMEGDAWTLSQSSITTGTVSSSQIFTIRIRTTGAAEQRERNCLVSAMHHYIGL